MVNVNLMYLFKHARVVHTDATATNSCPDNTYGPGCYTFCDCPEGVSCDPIVGCGNGTHTSKGASYNHSARQTTATVYHTDTAKDNTGTYLCRNK